MTCIVGIVDPNGQRVVLGGDSAARTDSNIYVRADPKVFSNKDFVIGGCASFRMIQLLRFSFTPPELGGKDVYEYMCTDFVDSVRECFRSGGFMQRYDSGEEKGETFLVGYKNRLFRVWEDFQVGESLCGYDACGSGEDFALGALFALERSRMAPERKAVVALKAAEYLSPSVAKPFILVST